MGKIRVAIYCRTCRDERALEAQKAMLMRYAEDKGYQVAGTFTDIGTGTDMSRPGLQWVELMAVNGEIDAVLATNCSRIARESTDLLSFAGRLDRAGVKLETLLDGMTAERLKELGHFQDLLREYQSI